MTMIDLKPTIELTKQLINIPSTSGHETEILLFLRNWLRSKGFNSIHREPHFVAAKIKGRSSERAFILSGHIDTVVPGDKFTWKSSPYQAIEAKGRIIGLGASDMLAGIASNLTVASSFLDTQLDYDLWVAATANEELDGQGSADFVRWFKMNQAYKSTSCLISEPSNLDQIEIGQRGNRFINLSFYGESGHGSLQENYHKSALAKLEKFLNDIQRIVEHLKKYESSVLGFPTLVPTSVNAGNPKAPNKTASRADLTIDLRTTPDLDAEFETFIQKMSDNYDFTWKYAASPVPSCQVSPELNFIQKFSEISQVNVLTSSASSNDSGFFVSAGIPTMVFGPGSIEQAHQANEFVEIDKVKKFTQILENYLPIY
ncbi:MAG: M20/M25/M40 family metallo-hydrolase [Streptococcaceae bacterium]|jgi:acetylornithine deacetylase|nr:M20/M25/M40 family metallo-hydrolase [Streptococcaceae bacterium]